MAASTTHYLPFTRFTRQVSTDAMAVLSTEAAALHAEDLLKVAPWMEAADTESKSTFPARSATQSGFNALWDAFKFCGDYASGYQKAYAGMVAYRFKIPAAALSGPTQITSIALPLYVVTMASQNVPGVAVIRASGYQVPISPLIGWTGAANFLLAPFGGFALNLAAITAAICMSREAHQDPEKRYTAAIAAGFFYLLIGLFGATVGALFLAFPNELVVTIAGFALLGTIGSALATAVGQETAREPALLTFLVTASGIALAGIGSAFWGLLAGLAALLVLQARPAPLRWPASRRAAGAAGQAPTQDDQHGEEQSR